MLIYATSKNTGPTWTGPDPIHLLYLGTSLKDAENAVGDFSKYEREYDRGEKYYHIYSALPRTMDWTIIKYYMADGWWYTIVSFEILAPTLAFDPSTYPRTFDETSVHWNRDFEYNRIFLECQQRYFNHLLKARGHVFLNEVYDALGFDRTSAGAVVGWLGDGLDPEGISFNLDIVDSAKPIVLNFNVQGIIYDQI